MATTDNSHERHVVLASSTATAMGFIDMTAVNTALPVMQQQLQASLTDVQWIVEIYLLFLTAGMLAAGALGDTVGRRRVFRWGVILFGVTSLGCAVTTSSGMLILARAFQGLAAALMVPSALALLNASYPPERRASAVGLWVAITSIAVPLGPLLGGSFTDLFGWPWIFLINLPLCGLALWAVRNVPRPRWDPPEGVPLDLPGASLATLALGGLTFAGLEAPRQGFDAPAVALALLLGLAGLFAFIRVEKRVARPMLPLELFRNPQFRGLSLQTFLFFGGFHGVVVFIPFMFIQARGYSAFEAGLTLLPLSVFIFLLSSLAGRATSRIKPSAFLIGGPLAAAVGIAGIGLAPPASSYWTGYFGWICLMSFGIGMTIAPLTSMAMNAVGEGRSGIGAAINNTLARSGQLLAVAVLGLVLMPAFELSLERQLDNSNLPAKTRSLILAQSLRAGAIQAPPDLDAAATDTVHKLVRTAYFDGFMLCMLGGSLLLVLSAAANRQVISAAGSKRRDRA